jgi:cytochrome b561
LFGRGNIAEMYMRSLHNTMGVTLTLVVFFRVFRRLTGARLPAFVEGDWLARIVRPTHHLLYVLAAAVMGRGS